MKKNLKGLWLILLLGITYISFSQSNQAKALEKGREAVKLMDDGKINESIKLLEEAQSLDPDRFDYPYELAYAYYLKEDYNNAIKILEKNINHKDVSERLFQLLGNSYDILGNSEKAFEIYDDGLKKFPNSGSLYLEKGNVYLNKKEYGKAVPFYEKGIEVDPKFPSNYYRAARLYCASSQEVWGILYGEIFMNLERNSKRTAEISKLIYDTYRSEIKLFGDSARIDFCDIVFNADDVLDKNKIKFPFCLVFGQALVMSIIGIDSININSLDKIRRGFLENYYKMNHNKTHPNILFDYQDKISKAGHLEAYNHWILMKGDENSFTEWQTANKDKWDNFVKWFSDNRLVVDGNNKFYRRQY